MLRSVSQANRVQIFNSKLLTGRRASLIVAMIAAGLVFAFIATPIVRADAKAVADARKALVDAQAAEKKATDAFTKAKDDVKAKMADPEAKAADEALTKAKADLEKATKPVLEKSHSSAEFKAQKAIFDDNDAKVKTMQMDPSAATAAGHADELTKLTTARSNARLAMDKLDADALSADPGVSAAKSAISDAQAKVDAEQKKLDDAAAADPACQTAKTALDDAQKKTADAKTALAAAIKAQQDAAKGSRGSGGSKSGGGNRPGGGGGGGGHMGGR